MTDRQIELAAQRQPARYILYRDKEGALVSFEDTDSGYYWVKLPGGWAWVC